MARTRRPARVFVAACGRSGRRGIAKAGPQWHRPGAEPGYALRSGTAAFRDSFADRAVEHAGKLSALVSGPESSR